MLQKPFQISNGELFLQWLPYWYCMLRKVKMHYNKNLHHLGFYSRHLHHVFSLYLWYESLVRTTLESQYLNIKIYVLLSIFNRGKFHYVNIFYRLFLQFYQIPYRRMNLYFNYQGIYIFRKFSTLIYSYNVDYFA